MEARGQTAILMAAGVFAFIGITGVAIDLGHGYFALQQLQSSTNAAALAGAAAMPNTTAATANVTAYSAMTGGKNANSGLTSVSLGSTPTFQCLTTLTSKMGLGCSAATGSVTGNFNAVKVTQTATVPLWFGKLFGVPALHISATATASMSGGQNTPWNIAVVVDTTASMASSDSGLQCSGTRITCALQGVQTMLGLMYPCLTGTNCTPVSGTQAVVNPVDSVSLFAFPAMTMASAPNDYGTASLHCPTTNPSIVPYTFQNVTTGTLANGLLKLPSGDTYQVVPTPTTSLPSPAFAGNYKIADASTTLNTAAQIVVAAGAKSGCAGLQAPGGQATYYAQVIYAAQAALIAQQTANPGSQNAMIILTDGDATACASNGYTSGGACNSASNLVATTGALNGTTQTGYTAASKISYAYPSALGECGQAVIAAQAATAAGTRVFTVGYGSPTSGCATDKTYSAYVGISPCSALTKMASAPGYFYSDNGAGCSSPNQTNFTQLKQIFTAISRNLTTSRLVPNGTT
jgi:hypothetical protein